jgi:hypothetical protein
LSVWPRGLVLDYGLPRSLVLHDVVPQAGLLAGLAAAAAHNFLAMVLATSSKLADAASHFRAAVQLDPSNEEARSNLERAERLLAR